MIEKIHPVRMPESALESNREIGRCLGALRYDQHPFIFQSLAKEILRQAEGDDKRGRKKLASLLRQAHMQALSLADTYQEIYELCRPYMLEEFDIHPEAE